MAGDASQEPFGRVLSADLGRDAGGQGRQAGVGGWVPCSAVPSGVAAQGGLTR